VPLWPGGLYKAPAVGPVPSHGCPVLFQWRACRCLGHSGAQKGKKHGEGQTSSEEAGESCPTMRVVCQPCAWRRRHGDVPRQGAGHVPCRVSVPVSRHPVAVGSAVDTTARAPATPVISPAQASDHGKCRRRTTQAQPPAGMAQLCLSRSEEGRCSTRPSLRPVCLSI